MRDKFPHLRNALPQIVPDENIIELEKEKSRGTVYQLSYAKKLGKDSFIITIISFVVVTWLLTILYIILSRLEQ